MSPALSTYLHILRFLSALLVFAQHAAYERFDGEWIRFFWGFGHEAVVVFFVLSGFVITFATDTRENTPSEYFISRFSRLWSVAIPALAVTLLFDWLGRMMLPALYADVTASNLIDYLASLVFLNEVWSLGLTPGSNIPYWSVSFEFMYYVLFGIILFCPYPWLLAAVAAVIVGPRVMLLMPAWILGSLAYHRCKSPLSTRTAWLLLIAGAAIALSLALSKFGNLYITWRMAHIFTPEIAELMGVSSAFVSDNLIGVGIAMHILGVASLVRNLSVAERLARMVRSIADTTFCIYMFHYPCLYAFTAASVYFTGANHGMAVGLASLAVGIIVTPYTEQLRRLMQRQLRRLTRALFPVTGVKGIEARSEI